MGFDASPRIDATRSRSPSPGCQPLWQRHEGQAAHRGRTCIALAIMLMTAVAVTVHQSPSAAADFVDNLQDAIIQARDTSCGAIRLDPLVDKTAAIVAETTDRYLNHTARVAPGRVNSQGQLIVDPLPILKDLGSNAGKAKSIEGAGKTQADAIKSILITGYKDIPDCSYTEYGVSALPDNNPDHYFLTALVLAGA